MRVALANLLVKSPFPQVSMMMGRVQICASRVPQLIERLIENDYTTVEEIAQEIRQLESEADDLKDSVRSKIPVRLFLPVDRRDLLRLISQIDAIADCAEDVAVLVTLRRLEVPPPLKPILPKFVNQVLEVVRASEELVSEYEDLIATGFSGKTAERVIAEVKHIARLEHEADELQNQCAKALFAAEVDLPATSLFIWTKVLNKIGGMANHAEHIADQFRLFTAS